MGKIISRNKRENRIEILTATTSSTQQLGANISL